MTLSRAVIVAGPSGVGKSTVLSGLSEKLKGIYTYTISHTTRKPRPGEKDAEDYYFIDKDEFERKIEAKHFLEHANYAGNYYGTSLEELVRLRKGGKLCFLDIDMQGVLQVVDIVDQDKERNQKSIDPLLVLITPPSREVLVQRLSGRGDTDPEAMKKRLEIAEKELAYENADIWDMVVTNDVVDECVGKILHLIEEKKWISKVDDGSYSLH